MDKNIIIGDSIYEVKEEGHKTLFRRWDDGMWVSIKFNNLITDEETNARIGKLKNLLNKVEIDRI